MEKKRLPVQHLINALLFILSMMMIVWMNMTAIRYENVRVMDDQGAYVTNVTSFRVDTGREFTLTLTADVDYRFYNHRIIHITPDDNLVSIRLNGADLPLTMINPDRLSDWNQGFDYPLGDYLRKGWNKLEIRIHNKFGPGGLKLGISKFNLLYIVPFILMAFLLIGLFFRLTAFTGADIRLRVILSLAMFIRLVYLGYTDFNVRTYDVLEGGGHLDYIHFVANHFALPKPNDGWEYHQPPLYYITAAPVYRFFDLIAPESADFALQLLSLSFFAGFLLVGYAIFRMMFKDKKLLYLAVALLAFWPSGIIHSVRIGNDVLFYFLYAAGFYYLLRWSRLDDMKNLFLSVLFGTLAFMTKANGIVLVGLIGIEFFVKWIGRKDKLRYALRRSWLILFVIAGLAVNFGAKIWYAMQDRSSDWLVGNVVNTINRDLFVTNQLPNYLIFDVKTFLVQPFTSTWQDWGGRQYFWNFLLKSSLFAEFSFPYVYHEVIASFISVAFLLMTAMFLYLLLTYKRSDAGPFVRPLLLNLLLFIVVLILYRAKIPASCNGDFRYILPSLLSFVPLVVYSSAKLDRTAPQAIRIGAKAVLIAFIVLSFLFF